MVKLGDPPEWHECKVAAVRDKPGERGTEQYQLILTEPNGHDVHVADGQWFAQELLWDRADIPTSS